MSAGIIAPPSNIATLAGPQLIGFLFNWGLYGVLSVQVYIYYLAFPKDACHTKIIVYGLYVLECLQVILATYDAWKTLGVGWGDVEALNSIQMLWLTVPILSGFISASVQSCFAWRIRILSGSRALGIVICMIAVTQGVSGITAGVQARIIADLKILQEKAFNATTVWLGGSALCDVVIASCMVYYLSKSKGHFNTTNVLISRLIRFTIETGMCTASVAIIDLILFILFQHNNLHLCPGLTLAKLYTNTLMALLNSRMRFVGGRVQDSAVSYAWYDPENARTPSRYFSHSEGNRNTSKISQPSAAFVNVDVVRETFDDSDNMSLVIMTDTKASAHGMNDTSTTE